MCRTDMGLYRMAAQYAHKRFDTMAQHNWLEMGLLSITIFIRTDPNGQLAVDMYMPSTHGYTSLTTRTDMMKLRTH